LKLSGAHASERGSGEGGQVKDGVHAAGRLPDEVAVPNVSDHDFEPTFVLRTHSGRVRLSLESMRGGLEIAKGARGEVVQDADGGPSVEQSLDEMGADETRTARDQNRAHLKDLRE
jgi:hypothetical protein